MKKTGADLAVHALEEIGVRRTFGIPGVHNTELYDALARSDKITPYLVTHELGGAFMADGLSRTSNEVGTLVIVPGAGTTHALSGIAEAFLDGIPMIVISGGIRTDSGRAYQLHDIDQEKMLEPVTKAFFRPTSHAEIVPAIFDAFDIATSGVPGPAFVEIPVNLQLFRGEVESLPRYADWSLDGRASAGPLASGRAGEAATVAGADAAARTATDAAAIESAVDLLTRAKRPGIFVGWGAVDATAYTAQLADRLVAPVATTLQGLSAFPYSHAFHTGVGFGPASVPAAQEAFKDCDCLLAVGVRFSELGTGSYGLPVPKNLIHVDIDPSVFDRNYTAAVKIAGDAADVLGRMDVSLAGFRSPRQASDLASRIAKHKQRYAAGWLESAARERVSPGHFFRSLRETLPDDSFVVADDGIHTFLTAELYPVNRPRGFISPTDFNAMGYAVPAAIGTRMGNPDRPVAAIVGDGAFLMTGMELITAVTHSVGVVVFVFHDGELGQISQFQQIPLNRKTCTVLGDLDVGGVARATGCAFFTLASTGDIPEVVSKACTMASEGRPVLVDVHIDYSRKTQLTKGVVQTNLKRFPLGEKARFVGRAAKRHLFKPED
ncbi:MAG: thiamine pyrophosphate-binding protein [Rhodothermia bacterium]|nr:thiamine pyrophosphate-binding protein [Rhodothermia bacterium]